MRRVTDRLLKGQKSLRKKRKKCGPIWEKDHDPRVSVNRIHPLLAWKSRRAAITGGILYCGVVFCRRRRRRRLTRSATEFLNPFAFRAGHMSQRKNVGKHLSARPRRSPSLSFFFLYLPFSSRKELRSRWFLF